MTLPPAPFALVNGLEIARGEKQPVGDMERIVASFLAVLVSVFGHIGSVVA
jgi:hypothetical protein